MFEVDKEEAGKIQEAIVSWFYSNGRAFPWRETDDPYKVLVAEILLQQTFARKVVPVYSLLISRYPDVVSLSGADESDVRDVIKPLGLLYRARTLINITSSVVSGFGGYIPSDLEGLLSLPGIGDYMAHAVLCLAFGRQVPVVDRNVIRVYKRVFGIPKPLEKINPTKKFWQASKELVPCGQAREYNLGILDFAALVCKHYSPTCWECPVFNMCQTRGSQ